MLSTLLRKLSQHTLWPISLVRVPFSSVPESQSLPQPQLCSTADVAFLRRLHSDKGVVHTTDYKLEPGSLCGRGVYVES